MLGVSIKKPDAPIVLWYDRVDLDRDLRSPGSEFNLS